MVLGILQFELLIPDPESLKDKRRVVRSVKDRLHREHMVSVAEVAAQDTPTVAVMGLALVGSDGGHVGKVLDNISAKLRALPDAELGECSRQILHGSDLEACEKDGPDESALADEMLRHFQSGDNDGDKPK